MTRDGVVPAEVEFLSPPPGLHPRTSFRLQEVPGAVGLYALRSLDENVRLFVLDPASVGHAYAPRALSAALAMIAAGEEDAQILLVANPTAEGVHVNLRAPILVHRDTGRATQTILEDQELPVRLLLGG